MSLHFEKIALFLNMISKKICSGSGGKVALTWLPGEMELDAGPSCECAETQILVSDAGHTVFWIANNEDHATDAQRDYLELLGINNFQKLNEHVRLFEQKLRNTLKAGDDQNGSKVSLFGRMITEDRQRTTPTARDFNVAEPMTSLKPSWRDVSLVYDADQFRRPTPPAPPENVPICVTTSKDVQTLTTTSNPFAFTPFCFIKDQYEKVAMTGDDRHAEQKLLAAFAKLLKTTIKGMHVSVHGCKPACAICKKVMTDARKSLKLHHNCTLEFVNEYAQGVRSPLGFTSKHTGISIMKLADHYYPLPDGERTP